MTSIYQEVTDRLSEVATLERWFIAFSLVNVSIFYAIIILVYLTARKSRLNTALASQKANWLTIILAIAIPAYVLRDPWLPIWVRLIIWTTLSPLSWWVLYEAYRANWDGTFREYLLHLKRQPAHYWHSWRCRIFHKC